MPVDLRLDRLLTDGKLGEALALIRRIERERRLTVGEQVVHAELLSDLTSSEAALELALHAAKRSECKKTDRARCFAVAGTVCLRSGRSESGLEFLKRAQDQANDIGDNALVCGVHLARLEGVLGWVSPEAASSELAAARWLVNAAGVPEYAIRFQLVLAEIEAKRGLLSRARHHLSIAEGLLDRFPNLFLAAERALKSAATAVLSSDLPLASQESRLALQLAKECDAVSLEVVARSNLGHAELAYADFEAALQELETAHRLCRVGGGAEIGIRDGLMQLALASSNVDEIQRQSAAIQQLSQAIDDGHSYYGLWHTLTRVRWLFRSARAAEGLSLALDAIPRIVAMADRQLLERMRLLAAEGLALTGRTAEAAALMAEAVLDNPDPPLGMVAEASRVAGRLAAADHPPAALAHFERAARILACLGNAAARAQVQATAGETLVLAGPAAPQVPGGDEGAGAAGTWAGARDAGLLAPPLAGRLDAVGPQAAEPHAAAARAVERVGAAIDLGMHPALVGHELLAVIAETRAAAAAALIEARPDGTRGVLASTGCDAEGARRLAADATAVHVPLGTGHGRTCEVVAASPSAASARVSLLAVERVAAATRELVDARERERQRAALWPEQTIEQQLGMIFASEVMSELVKTTRRVATTNVTVLITGETGTGKELLARALHQASSRREHPFVPFNCTAVAREMIDAQLFGYRRGAFTGAQDAFPGVIRAAAGGTLFLDEIGEVGMEVQPKLLRFLESGEVHPLGETRPEAVNVRVVAATNADLDRLVSEGRFREDLFYRLDVVRLHIPPLRERREEIPVLVDHFLSKYAEEAKKGGLRLAEETMEYLVLYRWPGNVRQLANELHRLVALAESGAVLMPEHLSREIATSRKTVPASERDLVPTELVVRIDQPMSAATEHLERAMILHAMRRTAGRVEDAARVLGLSRKGLYLKRQRFGLA